MNIIKFLLVLLLWKSFVMGNTIDNKHNKNKIKIISEKLMKEKVDSKNFLKLLKEFKNTIVKSKKRRNKEIILNLISFYKKIYNFSKNNSSKLSKTDKKEIIEQLKIIRELILKNSKNLIKKIKN